MLIAIMRYALIRSKVIKGMLIAIMRYALIRSKVIKGEWVYL